MNRTRGQTGNEFCCHLTAFYLYLHAFIKNSNELNGHIHITENKKLGKCTRVVTFVLHN